MNQSLFFSGRQKENVKGLENSSMTRSIYLHYSEINKSNLIAQRLPSCEVTN